MKLIRRTLPRTAVAGPWADLDELSNRLTRYFEEPFGTSGTATRWVPAVDVRETEDELILTAELPGLTAEDVKIELENSVLTLRGEKTDALSGEGAEGRSHVWERRYGSFQRAFTLPRSVKGDGIVAEFDDGVLTVQMPKAAEARGRKIVVAPKKK